MKERIVCPTCPNSNISLIPLAVKESYRLNINPKSGLEVSFSHKKNCV
jgi:adenosine deaminase